MHNVSYTRERAPKVAIAKHRAAGGGDESGIDRQELAEWVILASIS